MDKSWLILNPKIKTALAAALTLDGGWVIAWLNGTTTGTQALVTIIGLDVPVLVGYLTPAPVVAAVKQAASAAKDKVTGGNSKT